MLNELTCIELTRPHGAHIALFHIFDVVCGLGTSCEISLGFTREKHGVTSWRYGTVLVLIKLTKFAVALRLRCGSCKLIF